MNKAFFFILLISLSCQNVFAYLCTDYTSKDSFNALPSDCNRVQTDPLRKNPKALLGNLKLKYSNTGINFSKVKIGFWSLSNYLKLNELWLNYQYNPNYELEDKDLALIQEVKGIEFDHRDRDIYISSELLLATYIDKKGSPYKKKTSQFCLSHFSSINVDCSMALSLAYDEYLSIIIKDILNKNFLKVASSINKILSDARNNKIEAQLALHILQFEVIDSEGKLKNLPLISNTYFSHKNNITKDFSLDMTVRELDLLKRINLINSLRSQLMTQCLRNNCYELTSYLTGVAKDALNKHFQTLTELNFILNLELQNPFKRFSFPKNINTAIPLRIGEEILSINKKLTIGSFEEFNLEVNRFLDYYSSQLAFIINTKGVTAKLLKFNASSSKDIWQTTLNKVDSLKEDNRYPSPLTNNESSWGFLCEATAKASTYGQYNHGFFAQGSLSKLFFKNLFKLRSGLTYLQNHILQGLKEDLTIDLLNSEVLFIAPDFFEKRYENFDLVIQELYHD